jgi:hypothetical protein
MRLITEDAILLCDDSGVVSLTMRQSWVTINKRRVLVQADPVGRTIAGCTNVNFATGMKPCLKTLVVTAGYSAFLRIDGNPICLDTVTGLTDGTPPGTVKYKVKVPGQTLVGSDT